LRPNHVLNSSATMYNNNVYKLPFIVNAVIYVSLRLYTV
jgi:hypothetical protein